MRFQQKVAIVTGGSSGIGKETARRLAAEGASVVLSGLHEDKLHCAAEEIKGHHGRVEILAGDIAKPSTGAALVDIAERTFGGLDILVSNAGVFKPKPFIDVTEGDYDWFLNTILKSKFFLAQAAVKAMKRPGGGAIVHTGSMWALRTLVIFLICGREIPSFFILEIGLVLGSPRRAARRQVRRSSSPFLPTSARSGIAWNR
jgi:NAD(P)-dependent dehydrogenase (short-subunit alcohol dehydrogenase family)